ncbi:Flp pilus assembly protein CpaB [Undibacter mobilis]|uniref:Flp pilus assembly protein CpaB n=1 Tax=Undibacter mobilis TaxID=2292256 RepID=A0A371B8I2_9BRAD|nr:Flp pilus assembly protein CpaB [Undibacter mobilis]RDV03906.1 Flp pilus assembly protein CpaB [Undibacter mobilis]
MRASTFVMVGFALVFGVIAVFIAQVWLANQANRQVEAVAPQAPARTVVVAKQPLRYGAELTAAMLEELPWPSEAAPVGAFAKIGDVLKGGRRIVLSAIEAHEPVLGVKITGPGERATLSALVKPGMKAVTIRVNDVEGVGGFVLPGEYVDIVLTRSIDKGQATTEIVLQNRRVLAVDQSADERATKAAVAKSVTLEVDTVEAQKVWLASTVGNLSLLLRKAGETAQVRTRKITLNDLSSPEPVVDTGASTTVTISVTRAAAKQDYTVPVEAVGRAARALAETAGR